jgi:hypothetical protein
MTLPTVASSEREGRGSESRSATVLAFIGIFLLWWLLTALIYQQTKSNFLRAESGWYLLVSHSTPAVQHNFEKALLTKSFHGHYAPFGFLAEFVTAKLVGTHAGFWKWRQITVLALLATTLFLLARTSACALQLTGLKASLSAIGLTATLVFQAPMRGFIAWPFMSLQLFWLLFTLIALLSLVQIGRRPGEVLWPWLAAGASYASLHFLGLGIATVTATTIMLVGIWIGTRGSATLATSKIFAPLVTMIALTALHAVFMLKFPWVETFVPSKGLPAGPFVMAFLGFIPNFAAATVRSLLGIIQPRSTVEQISNAWPYGLALLLGFGFLVGSAFLRFRREPTVRNRTRFALQTFASVSFLTIIALILGRVWRESSPDELGNYLMGPRYLIPSTFALAGLLGELLFLFASGPILVSAILNLGLAVGAILGNLHYAKNVYPEVEPRSMISHAQAWHSLVVMARDCQRANLAIPNVPLGVLTQEFDDWDLKAYEPLLRADLKTPPGAILQFVDWPGPANELPNEYRDILSISEVKKRLRLEIRK